jgi:hypothetical protein
MVAETKADEGTIIVLYDIAESKSLSESSRRGNLTESGQLAARWLMKYEIVECNFYCRLKDCQ